MKLACVNWSGAQLEGYVVNGLDKQPLKFIVDKIAARDIINKSNYSCKVSVA